MATVSSTTLNVGLISALVSLRTAKETKAPSFEMGSPNGERVKQVYIVEDTGEIVGTSAEVPRGVWDGDTFRPVDKDTIKAIDESVKIDGITVEGFVSADDVPWERGEATYYVAPDKKAGSAGAAALRLLKDGLRETGKVGIGKLSLRTKQRGFVLHEQEGALFVTTLAFADSFAQGVSEAQAVLAGDPTSEGNLKLFGTLVENLTVGIDKLDGYTDEATALKAELVEAALAGKTIDMPAPAAAAPALDLSAALEASIAAAPKAKKKAA